MWKKILLCIKVFNTIILRIMVFYNLYLIKIINTILYLIITYYYYIFDILGIYRGRYIRFISSRKRTSIKNCSRRKTRSTEVCTWHFESTWNHWWYARLNYMNIANIASHYTYPLVLYYFILIHPFKAERKIFYQ